MTFYAIINLILKYSQELYFNKSNINLDLGEFSISILLRKKSTTYLFFNKNRNFISQYDYYKNKKEFLLITKILINLKLDHSKKFHEDVLKEVYRLNINEFLKNSLSKSDYKSISRKINDFETNYNILFKSDEKYFQPISKKSLDVKALIKENERKNKEYLEQRKAKNKETKLRIVSKGKSKIKLKCDIFDDTKGLGTLGDLFSNVFSGTKLKETETEENSIKIEDFSNTNNEPLFVKPKKKTSEYKNKNELKHDVLVLWDIENVNFYDDFSIITRMLPKNADKVFSYSKKNYKEMIFLKGKNLDFILNKLKKRDWIEKRTTKIADTVLIDEFNKRKGKIKELYLISADKDFEEICEEAIKLNIKVNIWNNENRRKKSWFNEIKYNYKLLKN